MKNYKILIIDCFDSGLLIKSKAKYDIDYRPDINLYELITIIDSYDILVISTRIAIQKPLIDKAKNLKLIIRMGAGVDHIDLKYCNKSKIIVCNTPNSNVSPVAEFIFCQLLRLFRNPEFMDNNVINGNFRKGLDPGEELSNRSIGIIGVGRIGRKVVKIAKSLGMIVYANDPYLTKSDKSKLEVDKWLGKNEIAKKSDIVTFHVPLTEKTKYIINNNFLSQMKKNSILINAARGKILKFDDAVKFAKKGIIRKFIIDVFEDEPFKPGISDEIKQYFYFSPHAGAYTKESFYNRSLEAIEQIEEFLKKKKPHGIIDPVKGY